MIKHLRADARRTSALGHGVVTKLGPLRRVKLLKNQGDRLVVRSPEKAGVGGSTPSLATIIPNVRSGDIGNRTFRRHRLHFWPEGVLQGLQGFFLQINITEIVIHKTDQPDAVIDFFDTTACPARETLRLIFSERTNNVQTAIGSQDGPCENALRNLVAGSCQFRVERRAIGVHSRGKTRGTH